MPWDEETNQRLEAVHAKHRAMGTRARPDPLTAPATTAEAVADSVGKVDNVLVDSARRRR
jgi:hypothetical protein